MKFAFYNGKVVEYDTPAKMIRSPPIYPALKTEPQRTDSDRLLQEATFSQQQVKCLLACVSRERSVLVLIRLLFNDEDSV